MEGPVGSPTQRRAGASDLASVTIWYIRHGHNPANQPPRRLSHQVIDYPLTDLGVTQATTLGERLARHPAPAAIYASPLRRATQTAGIIARHAGTAVTVLEDLRELNVGELDGRHDEQAWAIHDQVLADWSAGRHDSAFPGGENHHQMTARLTAALRRTAEHPPGSRVLVVAHGGIIRAAIPAICPGTPIPATDLRNCGIAELKLQPAPNGNGITATLTQPVSPGTTRRHIPAAKSFSKQGAHVAA
jgi:broad specificity phosphatase PhoE